MTLADLVAEALAKAAEKVGPLDADGNAPSGTGGDDPFMHEPTALAAMGILADKLAAAEAALAAERTGCPLMKRLCPVHGFWHGGESEELRERLQAEIDGESQDGTLTAFSIQHVLDDVDARDSCAYVEAKAVYEKREAEGGVP